MTMWYKPHTVLSVDIEETRVLVRRLVPSFMSHGNGDPAPDTLIYQEWEVEDGKLVLKHTQQGRRTYIKAHHKDEWEGEE